MTTRCTTLIHGALTAVLIAGCQSGAPSGGEPKDDQDNSDIEEALNNLPEASVLMYAADGVPQFIVGDLAHIGALDGMERVTAESVLRPALSPVLKAFRLTNDDLVLKKVNTDANGHRHFRFTQQYNGMEVVGSQLIAHVDQRGALYSVNGTARADLLGSLGAAPIALAQATSRVQSDARFAGLAVTGTRTVYVQSADGRMHKAHETTVEGFRGQDPAHDKVFVDQDTGEIVAVHPKIHFAENRQVYSANNGTSLPGTLRRSEGQAPTTDLDVNGAYDGTGATYEQYQVFFGRDSYNNAGAAMRSSVHYSSNYCNAFWNGTQMAYGDGNAGQNCGPLARSLDVTAHELTHAVTENESGLIYSGESGGLNESYSDIWGAIVEAWVNGGKVGTNLPIDAGVFLVGEDVLPPFLRNMGDPAADGSSLDFWTSGAGNVDVHYSSGIANLAFKLLSTGGQHPRGKTTVQVPNITMEKAARIWYKAQVDILTPSSNYAAMRTATIAAAQQLGYDQATQDAVGCAWAAVNVGSGCGGTPPPPPPGDTILANGVPVTGQTGAVGSEKFYKLTVPAGQATLTFTISGGTGDADMYTRLGSHPTQSVYTCRPYLNGNNETCTVANPAAGDWYVMLVGYTAYSGVTITGTYSGGGGGDPYLTRGVPVTGISGASGNTKFWRVAGTAGQSVSVRISGGTGDADLYTRFGSRPTTTTYSCRPYLNGNTETCNFTFTSSGDLYVMLRAFSTYSGVSLVAQ